MGKMGKKYMEKEGKAFISLSFYILFSFFPKKTQFSHGQKWGWTPPPFTGFLPTVMRILSYKTSSPILMEEYYVFSKLKYQASCTLTSIKSNASMNKCISHVRRLTLLTGVLTPAAKGAKPINCPETLCRQ